ncbi:MAG: hypothetical protein CVU56_14435 [Deltaproteobacteria bacterium HGW-Deltaproteobacteria-14]|jgi:opacity protein-like surface antigen|nr:MAG: hypothetical protein CVU56_14435 [Deltaproteobacteria bacterium HGW-Deltaproteobacteria-14]
MVTTPRPALAALAALAGLLLLASPASASPRAGDDDDGYRYDPYGPPPAVEAAAPFSRAWGLSAYYSRWAGGYDAGGVGFRIRWEPLELLGIEVFAELLDVTVPTGSRVNLPSGFNLYVPLELLDGFRVRALAGLCTMFTFDSAGSSGGPDTQDVQLGVHVGLGAELALTDQLSLFLDATYQGYWGHGRELGAWTATLEDELRRQDSVQVGLGLQFHL